MMKKLFLRVLAICVILLGIAIIFNFAGGFGFLPGGSGWGKSAAVIPPVVGNDSYSFSLRNNQIFYEKGQIARAKFDALLTTAQEKNLLVELFIEEASITSGFEREILNLVKSKVAKWRKVIIRSE